MKVGKSYIVYLGSHTHSVEEASFLTHKRVVASHHKLLGSVLGSEEKARDAIFYSYTASINGFAANLEEEEAISISKLPGVVSVFPNRARKLHTTHSWDFLKLESRGRVPADSLWSKANYGEDVIVANLDTGVWPESESFKDDGLGPIPPKWRGICQKDKNVSFPCNRKLIGARYFSEGFKAFTGLSGPDLETPRDTEGHGSHTLSTAAGRFVPGVNAFGHGKGTAKGGAPKARVASYKVCWPPVPAGECFDVDILAGFDAAIHDGVHVLSVSLGGTANFYFDDALAVGAFHAFKSGITVVCSAGNSGPTLGTVSNVAPWIITVGASTLDRQFSSHVYLKNGKRIEGQSLSSGLPTQKLYPLVSAATAWNAGVTAEAAQLCLNGALNPAKVKGKIVVCLRGQNGRAEKGGVVRRAGGVGMILVNDEADGDDVAPDPHVLPATHISYSDGSVLFSYLNSTRSPFGYISTPTTNLGTYPAPRVASFSSQGPNLVTPELLKPDITAPGVSIIAAYTKATGPTDVPFFDRRRVPYTTMSGTSMSCPHVAGVVALLKAAHPDWSPSEIKSAIMTTARTRDNLKEPLTNASLQKATPFSYGSGHIRPNRAVNPGLVYPLTTEDHMDLLCALGYTTSTQLALFLGRAYVCPFIPLELKNFNYPSITLYHFSGPVTVERRLKNVGPPGTYKVRVNKPFAYSVAVEPKVLEFKKVGEEKTFNVTFNFTASAGVRLPESLFGRLIWSDGKHYVRSTITLAPNM